MSSAALRVLGIDPGATGAIASISQDGRKIRVWDLPYQKIVRATRSKSEIVYPALALLFEDILSDFPAENTVAYLEWVNSSPQMGVASAFNFGESFGAIRGVLAAHLIETKLVLPQTWKKACRIKAGENGKDRSRNLAMGSWPQQASLFQRKMDDGRAEASLIAWFGWQESQRAQQS